MSDDPIMKYATRGFKPCTDVEILKRVVDRLDITIEKLAEVSNGINKILAVHESRIDTQEETTRQLMLMMEERRREYTIHHDDMKLQYTQLRKEFIDELNLAKKELELLNRWKYLVLGGAVVIGFILSRTNILEKLF